MMRYAAFFHDIAKPECRTTDENGRDHFKKHAIIGADRSKEIMKRLKMDNDTIKTVSRLVYWHDYGIDGNVTKRSLRRMMSKFGAENFPDYLAIRRADMDGQSSYMLEEKEENYRYIESLYREIISDNDCLTIKDLAVNGQDIMNLGVPAGPKVGEVLNSLLEKVMDDPELNEKDILTGLVKEYINE